MDEWWFRENNQFTIDIATKNYNSTVIIEDDDIVKLSFNFYFSFCGKQYEFAIITNRWFNIEKVLCSSDMDEVPIVAFLHDITYNLKRFYDKDEYNDNKKKNCNLLLFRSSLKFECNRNLTHFRFFPKEVKAEWRDFNEDEKEHFEYLISILNEKINIVSKKDFKNAIMKKNGL